MPQGAFVYEVSEGSAAEQAGIHGIHFTGYEDGVSQLKKLGVL